MDETRKFAKKMRISCKMYVLYVHTEDTNTHTHRHRHKLPHPQADRYTDTNICKQYISVELNYFLVKSYSLIYFSRIAFCAHINIYG